MLLEGKVEKFLAVARRGSMSQAAKDLYVSQPSLTTQIRKLEEEVGFTLFDRTPQGVQLTEAGAAFQEAMERVRDICEQAVDTGRRIEAARASKITIGILDSPEAGIIKPTLDAFHLSHPEIGIEFALLPHAFDKRRQMLADGLVDCFLYGMRQETLGDDLSIFPFFSTGECLVMPPDYDLAGHRAIEPGELSGRTIYLPKEDYRVSPTKTLRELLAEEHPGIDIQEKTIDAAFIQSLPYLDTPFVSLEKIMGNVPGVAISPLKSAVTPALYGLVYPKEHREPLDFLLACLAEQWDGARV